MCRRSRVRTVADSPRFLVDEMLWVPKTLSTSCDQAVFVDQATDARQSSDAVLSQFDRLG
jgi:hypothetical protein